MDQSPLVNDQIDPGARLVAEFDKYATVQSAFWLKESEGDWHLYITSDQIKDDNIDRAYREVHRITHILDDPSLNPFDVKLIGADDPLAQAVMGVKNRHPSRMHTLFRDRQIGGIEIQGLQIYGSPIAAPSPR